MRLLIIASEFPPGPGGIGTHAFEVARQMENQGWEVKVMAMQDYAEKSEIEAFQRGVSFEIVNLREWM